MMAQAVRIRGRSASAALGAGAAVTAILVLVACSASKPQPAGTRGAAPAASGSAARTPLPGRSGQAIGTTHGQLGSTLAVSDSSGTKLAVTLRKVIDPASGANQFSKPGSGKHFAGIKLQVQNKAARTYQNNANNETTIVLSDGKTLHADYNPIAGCGNFSNGQIKLKAGATTTGCVTFQVPKGQKVVQVSYGNTVFPGTTAQWRLS